jgi:hypothetical protein
LDLLHARFGCTTVKERSAHAASDMISRDSKMTDMGYSGQNHVAPWFLE